MPMSEQGYAQLRFRQELGARIATTAAKFSTKAAAARAAGVSVEQFNKWICGNVKVPVEALKALADTASVDFSWLVTGVAKERERLAIEESDLGAIGEMIASFVLQCSRERNVILSELAFVKEVMRRLSQLIRVADDHVDKEVLLSLMPWLKLQIRRDAVLLPQGLN